ncbi:MAG: hypothetical protein ACUVTN_11740 [Thermodesulfobacteriota bacterium]
MNHICVAPIGREPRNPVFQRTFYLLNSIDSTCISPNPTEYIAVKELT